MTIITRLTQETINRIAAGEVIERPAAAVKELVENALDADATRIDIAIEGGGIARIAVIDNGSGIAQAQLPLAIERHATSKLRDDALIHITTLGFRGEALPSIGAAARLTLTSRPAQQDSAARITVEGGVISRVSPIAAPFGTSAEVTDLFFATPARRKFLRSIGAETAACSDIVRDLALAAPAVGFAFRVDGKTQFDLPPQDRRARLAALIGHDDAAQLIPIDTGESPLTITGFIGPASLTRAAARHNHITVNGRPVRDPMLRMAVRLAYREVIPPGRHPIAALWLNLAHDQLDVNVHPAKSELRFAEADAVRSALIRTIRAALASPATSQAAPSLRYYQPARPSMALQRGFAEREIATGFDLPAPALRPITPSPDSSPYPLGAPIAQIFDTYILALAADDTLILVDQHAAHERLTEERLRRERDQSGIARHALLSPIPVDLPAPDIDRLLAAAPDLAQLGLDLESFGPGAVLVRAIPAALDRANPAALIRDIADSLADHGSAVALTARLDAVLIRMACHRSIRAGRRLTAEEMSALLRAMEATPRAQTCPHGRPTVLRLSRDALERMFGRAGL
ncbi:MAG TPA: DNA mismatch repair endonuclease MutL [Acidiphilium sp.]|nr:MAG: DNA mismatch repair protein MutL [Acidiphilium sp. 21-60-14]OYV90594.1 MAG: DNA mismatch repair protein MutL [Acidiphilium sp. 37-60-79]OZB41517.1 MAG: DNA mismatch repair protein MutL [Acidiphilium sp. 34-60-192]HQT89800.1 DNA mismatch repair endonuclease MutL [Acidiphilium sp.]HQU25261.1 DNA mismatch repair endonuclease MutL [Acidiphilium sp.]